MQPDPARESVELLRAAVVKVTQSYPACIDAVDGCDHCEQIAEALDRLIEAARHEASSEGDVPPTGGGVLPTEGMVVPTSDPRDVREDWAASPSAAPLGFTPQPEAEGAIEAAVERVMDTIRQHIYRCPSAHKDGYHSPDQCPLSIAAIRAELIAARAEGSAQQRVTELEDALRKIRDEYSPNVHAPISSTNIAYITNAALAGQPTTNPRVEALEKLIGVLAQDQHERRRLLAGHRSGAWEACIDAPCAEHARALAAALESQPTTQEKDSV